MLRNASDRLNFQYLVQALPQAAAVVLAEDPDYPIVAANDAYVRALGYDVYGKRSQGSNDPPSLPLIGRPLFDMLRHGKDAKESLRRSVQQVVTSGRIHTMEYRDEARLWSFTHCPLTDEDGSIRHVVHYAHRQDAAEPVSAQNDHTGSLFRAFEGAATGLAVFDRDGALQRCNHAFATSVGYSVSQLRALDPALLIHPADREQRQLLMRRVLSGDIPTFVTETRYLRSDGEEVYCCDSVSLLEPGSGAEKQIVVISENITRRRKAERALLQTEGLVTMGRLSASIAHELNNPLESVTNLLFLIANSKLQEDTQYYAKLAEQELARVTKIATQTLRFYRPQSAPAPVDLGDVMESVLALFEGRIRREQVKVTKRYGHDLPPLLAYSSELRQVFVNLVGNALDSMDEGGRLSIAIHPSRNWKRDQVEGIRVTVCDAGSGIPKSMLEKVFEPFVSTKEKSGTGLGLWISKDIVQRHGGILCVRSRQSSPRQGTCMSVFLPTAVAQRDVNAA